MALSTAGRTAARARGLRAAILLSGRRLLGTRALAARLEAEREQWFPWVVVGFGAGIGLYFAFASEPTLAAALAAAAVAFLLYRTMAHDTLMTAGLGLLVASTTGFAVAKIRSDLVAAPVLKRPLINVEVVGHVEQVEPRTGRGQRITLRVLRLGDLGADDRPVRARIRTMHTMEGLAPGETIRLRATLAPPSRPALPGDYDFGRAAWFLRIGAVGYAVQRPERIRDAEPAPLRLAVWQAIERVRQGITERIVAALPGERGHLAAALITGERGGISEETNAAYRASGLFHILSISGLHMVVMAGAVFWTSRLVLAAVPRLALDFPIKKWAAAAAIVAAFAYLLISGAQPATQRSWITITVAFLAVILDRPAISMRTVAVAALAILVVWPESILDIGFQMSFAAVTALVAVYDAIRRRRGEPDGPAGPLITAALFFGGIILTTLVASFAVAPFGVYHFHQSQQYAVLANLIAIPVCNVLAMPAALATLIALPFGLESVPLAVMGVALDAMGAVARWVAALPGATAPVPAIRAEGFALIVGGGLWLALWATGWRLLGLAAIAAGLAIAPLTDPPDLLVGRDGQLVAVRDGSGRLWGLRARGTSFELKRWLEHDGDARSASEATAGDAFRCDAIGCVANVNGRRIAVIRHPAAVADDCAEADIVVMPTPAPASCKPRGAVLDLHAVRDRGTHAIRLPKPGGPLVGARAAQRSTAPREALPRPLITTVADARGSRPWARDGATAASSRFPGLATSRSRLAAFAAPDGAFDADPPPRPEIEDDDGPWRPGDLR